MEQFERFAQPDLFVEESDIAPVIIKYTDINVRFNDKKNDILFKDAIKNYEGIHTCVFVNDGISKGINARSQFLIILEGVDLSIRVQIDGSSRSFFGPTLLSEKPVIPSDENEFIRRRCDIRFVNDYTDVIDIATEMKWGSRLSELKAFVQSIAELKRPLKEIRKEEDQAIWSSYAEGLEALTKAKQELRRIKRVGKVQKTNKRNGKPINGKPIDVIELEIDAIKNSDVLKQNLMPIFESCIKIPFFESSEDGKDCSIIFDGYREFSEEEMSSVFTMAEESCYRLTSPKPNHRLRGEFIFKSSDKDNEHTISTIDDVLRSYDDAYPQKDGNRYYFTSDADAEYAKDAILQRFKNVVKVSPSTEVVVTFVPNEDEYLVEKLSNQVNGVSIIPQGQYVLLRSKSPIDVTLIEKHSLIYDSCRVTLGVSKFNPRAIVPSALSAVNTNGYYGIIHDCVKIESQSKGWISDVRKGYTKFGENIRCFISEYIYAFKKMVDKESMKSIARALSNESSIRVNTAQRCACYSPENLVDYEQVKEKIASVLPLGIIAEYQDYKPSLTISFLNEDDVYRDHCFMTIGNSLSDMKLSQQGERLIFRTGFDDEVTRDRLVARLKKISDDYNHLFELNFETINGTTILSFREDGKLRSDFEKNLQSDFGRQDVRLIPSSYDSITTALNNAINENDLERRSTLVKDKNDMLYKAELIGTCINHTRSTVRIELCEDFLVKLNTKEIVLSAGDYIQFPLIGESANIRRQKDAIDRILKPGTRNRYGKIIPSPANPNLSNFLFDPRYASETISDIEMVKEQIKERQIESNMNDKQREAVAKAIEAQDIAFIQGPPGTGKTTVIAEIIWQEILRNPSCKILLTSQTNTAVDNALERLQGKRGIRPVRIPKMDGEARMVREGKRYLLTQFSEWSEKPTAENSDNAVNIWVDTILREMNPSNRYSQVIARWKQDLSEKDRFVRKTFAESYLRNVNLIAATCNICGSKNFNEIYNQIFGTCDMNFDVVIMDEASKATPLEMAIPMVLGKKIILIGDHKQLPPIVDDEEVQEALRKIGRGDLIEKLENIKESQFKRLFETSQKMRPSLVSTLDTQYRMHKQIMNCIKHFYKDDIVGGLQCGIEDSMDNEDWTNRGSRYHGLKNDPFINPDVHAIWVNVDGEEEKNGYSPYNRAELNAIKKILKNLRASEGYKEYISHCTRPEDEEIGIITFYGAQVKEIQKMYKEGELGPGKYKIDVVDSFQGMERNIVIISTVRTKKIGFAKEIERINVAFSRAKRLLIVVGKKDFFANNPDYRISIQAMDEIGINQLS